MRKKPNEYSANDYRYYLVHHGILGMRWGRKNGPPYPLDASDHSSSEKKAGWRKSLEGSVQKMKEERLAKGEQKIAKQRFDRAMYDESMALTKKSDRVIDDYLNLTEQYDDLYKKAATDSKLTSYLQKKVEKLADDYSYDGSESYQRDLLSDNVDDAIDDWLNKTDEGRSVQKNVKDIDKRCDELRGPELEKSFERVVDASGETSNSSKTKNQIMDELWKSMGYNTYEINSIQGELYDFNKDLDSRYDLIDKVVDDFWKKKTKKTTKKDNGFSQRQLQQMIQFDLNRQFQEQNQQFMDQVNRRNFTNNYF